MAVGDKTCPVCNVEITKIDLCYASDKTKAAWQRSVGGRRMRVVQKMTVRADQDVSKKGVGSWEKGT